MEPRLGRAWRTIMKSVKEAFSERGSALLEFAFAFTILMTLIFGIMDFSRAMYAYHFLSDAAREATRYASVRGSTSTTACTNPPPVVYGCKAATADIANYVQSIVAPGISVSSTSASCASPAAGQVNVCTTWPGTAPSGATGACNTANGNDSPGCLVQVKVMYAYGITLPFVSKDVSTITMTSTSETVILQ